MRGLYRFAVTEIREHGLLSLLLGVLLWLLFTPLLLLIDGRRAFYSGELKEFYTDQKLDMGERYILFPINDVVVHFWSGLFSGNADILKFLNEIETCVRNLHYEKSYRFKSFSGGLI